MPPVARLLSGLALTALLVAPASARPFLYYRGILNAASFAPEGLPNGAIARGSIFSLFGRDLGPAEPAIVSEFPLGASLAGVSVEVCRGEDCRSALPLFVAAGQINAVLPSDAPLGRVAVRVSYDGEAGNWSPITVVESSVGLFAVNSAGFGPSVTQNFVSQTEQPINSRRVAARPGQIVTLWGTGLGAALNPDRDAPFAGDLPVEVEIFVGGARVTNKLYSGRTPCCSGVDQIVFEIPADAPLGCYAPVLVRTNGTVVSNSVSMAISADGSACEDGFNPLVASLAGGGRVGSLLTAVFDVLREVDSEPAEPFTTELAGGYFVQPAMSDFYFNQLVMPPEGSCKTLAFRGDTLRGRAMNPVPDPSLDAGEALTLNVGGRSLLVGRSLFPQSFLEVLSSAPTADGEAVVREGDAVRTTAAGGADVGNVEGEATARAPLRIGDRAALTEVRSGRPLTLEWTPGDVQDQAVIWGEAYSVAHDASGRFVCVTSAAAGALIVPDYITAQLPATANRKWAVDAWIALGVVSKSPPRASAAGLDDAAAIFGAWQMNTVAVRD
ncbi:MAG: hypothetical protein GC160_07560 [Acidobacteria bacterium]|nr:hypothetical protein [Acidobacteriota bacterium]